ncbi:MAG: hypothetical protein AB1765_03620 [Candidatus Hydrogenedentota bacterium]
MQVIRRVNIELKLSFSMPDRASRSRLSEGLKHRIRKQLERNIIIMGIKVHNMLIDSARIKLDLTLPPNTDRPNIERALYGILNGILKREVPHLVKRRM